MEISMGSTLRSLWRRDPITLKMTKVVFNCAKSFFVELVFIFRLSAKFVERPKADEKRTSMGE